jgi:beta-glucanase (GH16 family)
MEQTGNMIQAGRSETALSAEKESAGIQPQPTTSIPPPGLESGESSGPILGAHAAGEVILERPSTSSSPRRDSSGSTLLRSGSSLTQIEGASTFSMNAMSSYVPAIPSPLNPASSQSSVSSSDENAIVEGDVSPVDSLSSGEASRRQSTGHVMAAGGKRKGSNLSPAQQILRQKTMPLLRPGEIARPGTPRLLKDLGRDYSRYPSSRSDSRPPASPLPATAHSRAPLLRTTTVNPFSDSQADLHKYGFPDDSIGVFDPYFGGEKGFILYESEVEEDDKWHMPADDDDITYRPNWKEYWDRRQIVSFVGGVFLVLGLLCVFIVLPVLTWGTNIVLPGGSTSGNATRVINDGPAWAHVNNNTYPLLKNVRKGLIDPTTPASAKARTSTFDGSKLNLVFSDEFNDENRTFYPGDDPYWTAPNIWYGATQDLEWYDPVAVTTGGGTLQLTLSNFPNHGLQYMSGMLNSWNQLCFKGGVFEVSVSLPGPAGVPGLWPGVWTMGNLGRPGYLATTDGVWPYTYNTCDAGITPNQSASDGMNFLPGQKLSSCSCKGEDHPNPGTGRGAPEIDILEAAIEPSNLLGVVTQSFQVAPFDVFWRPNSDFMQIPNYNTTSMNGYCGGPYQQAVSATTLLNDDWYDGNAYQKYAFEYIPGTPGTGKIAWFVGEDQSFLMDGRAIGANGNAAPRLVSEEPMSMVLNLGFSGSWGAINLAGLKFPTTMHIDYVRIYQKPGEENITCDPPGYPTTEYIANHGEAYNNPNLTVSLLLLSNMRISANILQHWNQTSYAWPKNTLTGNC